MTQRLFACASAKSSVKNVLNLYHYFIIFLIIISQIIFIIMRYYFCIYSHIDLILHRVDSELQFLYNKNYYYYYYYHALYYLIAQ